MGKAALRQGIVVIQRAMSCQLLLIWSAVRTVKGMHKPTASAFTVAEASIVLVNNSTGAIAIARRYKAKR